MIMMIVMSMISMIVIMITLMVVIWTNTLTPTALTLVLAMNIL